MKKFNKLFLLLICAITLITLAGCTDDTSKGTANTLFKQMQRKDIVSKNYKEIDTVEECYWRSEHCQCTTYYIYDDGSSNLIAITYSKAGLSSDYKYYVNVFLNIGEYSDIHYLNTKPTCGWDTTYYTYKNGDVSSNNKYRINNQYIMTYGVKVKKSFFSNKYTFEKK